MDRNAKLVPLSHEGKVELLRQLKGRAYFQRTLTRTTVLGKLTVPAWFVNKHGNEVRERISLRTLSSKQSWTVSLQVFVDAAKAQVRVAGGWTDFVTFHGLLEGDLLIFSLTEESEFEVHLCRGNGRNLGEFPSQPPTSKLSDDFRFNDFKISSKKAKQWDEHEEDAFFPSGQGSSSCSIDLNLLSDSEKDVGGDPPHGHRHHSYTAQDLAVGRSWCDLKSKSDTGIGRAQQTVSATKEDDERQAYASLRKSSPPRFFRILTISNLSPTKGGLDNGLLEIPTAFWRTYGNQIHPLVKLQGIREDSPTRTVACARHLQANQYWRFRLTTGWKAFASENNLEVNELLQFTLAGDSFFVVRRVGQQDS